MFSSHIKVRDNIELPVGSFELPLRRWIVDVGVRMYRNILTGDELIRLVNIRKHS